MNIGDIVRDLEGTSVIEEAKSTTKATKSKVKVYKTIRDALSKATYGSIFSTKRAGRIYVISKGTWGDKSGRGKIAKGFTKGSATPNASWPSIKGYSIRTRRKHGKAKEGRLDKRAKELTKQGKGK